MEVIITITPIFVIILLGWVARKKGFISAEFLEPANRLVYYISIPALIFNSIAKTSFQEQFNLKLLFLTLLAAVILYVSAELFARLSRMTSARAGAFVQSSGHGNLGYIGLPIALYYLGDDGLAKAGIICGFLMILQNFLSVVFLQLHVNSTNRLPDIRQLLKKLLGNPVIIGAMGGILVSVMKIPVPKVIGIVFHILGGLAPPMALLLIGASISVRLVRVYWRPALGAVMLKLLILPFLGVVFFRVCDLTPEEYLPALILLCSPTATLAYVMAREMGGDADFAVAAISASTLFSSLTFILWLAVITHI